MSLEDKTKQELIDIAEALHVLSEKRRYNKQDFLFPDDGPVSRDKYPKQICFFDAGKKYKERAIIAGNRTGKTYATTAETSWHLNGKYPHWWKGAKFTQPIRAWAVGKTHETTRDILQKYLLGARYDLGSGMIPKEDILRTTTKPGIPDALQDVYIKHYTNGLEDGVSELSFKSYVQGVEAFMGTAQHLILLDEEPDNMNIYTECITRTATTNGLIIAGFTPLNGLSETVMSFLPEGRFPEGGIGIVE